jgi:hypothetical protein
MFGFYSATAEADFVFPPEIREYLDEVFDHSNRLHAANKQYKDYTQTSPAGYDHQAIGQSIEQHKLWFCDQPKIAKEKFKPFLDLTK